MRVNEDVYGQYNDGIMTVNMVGNTMVYMVGITRVYNEVVCPILPNRVGCKIYLIHEFQQQLHIRITAHCKLNFAASYHLKCFKGTGGLTVAFVLWRLKWWNKNTNDFSLVLLFFLLADHLVAITSLYWSGGLVFWTKHLLICVWQLGGSQTWSDRHAVYNDLYCNGWLVSLYSQCIFVNKQYSMYNTNYILLKV